ncbi:MAG TPA: DeoR/GlpR family DNA-binding transcription regulator [Terracidiphilus sp.]|nr:DeoR/GlpR family DNA-binding transcription regulator [Terracidiphilus sp.]
MRRSKNNKPLLAEQRRRKILDLLEQEGQITVQELVERFGMSAVTIRSDLDALGASGAVVRSHGGAVRRLEPTHDYPLSLKASVHRAEKTQIGQAAANLIQPGEVIILDSGTTTAEIARQLKVRGLSGVTVITNAVNVVSELMDAPGISVIGIGGILRPVSISFVGPQAETMLKELNADRLFLAVDGFDLEGGASTPDVLEAQLNSLMMKVAKETTVVADFSKLGRRSVSRIGSVDQVHRLITDSKAPEAFVQALRARGIEVIQS